MQPLDPYRELRGGVNLLLQGVEKSFDCAGYFWIIAPLTGGLRIVYGQVEIISAVAFLTLFQGASFFCSEENKKFYCEESDRMVDYVIHGAVNIFRGEVECAPFLNVSCLLYDLFVAKEKENLRLSYDKPLNWVQNLKRFYNHGYRV